MEGLLKALGIMAGVESIGASIMLMMLWIMASKGLFDEKEKEDEDDC